MKVKQMAEIKAARYGGAESPIHRNFENDSEAHAIGGRANLEL